MHLERLKVSAFRNLASVEIEPALGINWFIGQNGQGKTALLEAVAILASLKSFRDSKPNDWIQNHQDSSNLEAWLMPASQHQDWRSHFRVSLTRSSAKDPVSKAAEINGKRVRTGAGFLKQKFGSAELAFHVISFNPSDHDLIRGDPAQRRAYLDRVISAENADYLEKLVGYSKTLDQRNALLKDPRGRYREVLQEFTEPLIRAGAYLIRERLKWLDLNLLALQKMAARISSQLPEGTAALELSYSTKIVENAAQKIDQKNNEIGILNGVHFAGHHTLPSLEIIENWLQNRFEVQAQEELRQGVTLLGPHRDDWMISSQGYPLKGRGSQGEVRTALLALKLAEISSFRHVTSHRPVLLLDDFSSELDLSRRQFLMEAIQETDLQVFVTSTESAGLPGKKFKVTEGKIFPE